MSTLAQLRFRLDRPSAAKAPHFLADFPDPQPATADAAQIILSFDVEEHFRIEAASGLAVGSALKAHYCDRLETSTQWLLDELAARDIRATFFIVGQIALQNTRLVRAICQAGHEVASHGWDHQRIHNFTRASFAEDLRKSRDALEQATGRPVVGYRAPTFSIVRQTAWAIDVLAEAGLKYDSSVYPVRHDRYGIPLAPRAPFRAIGNQHSILEIPPATLRLFGLNMPVGGGGYFRLLPLFVLERTLRQIQQSCAPAVAMLYFHPWEFDPEQQRLPLSRLNRFRTYVGINRSRGRLEALLEKYRFAHTVDVAQQLERTALPRFALGS